MNWFHRCLQRVGLEFRSECEDERRAGVHWLEKSEEYRRALERAYERIEEQSDTISALKSVIKHQTLWAELQTARVEALEEQLTQESETWESSTDSPEHWQ